MFVHHLAPASVAVGGVTVAESGLHAPFFVLQLLEGRPVDVRHRALAEVTDVIVDVFGADRANVRGLIARIDPDDWVIGGVPVSVARAGSAPSGRP